VAGTDKPSAVRLRQGFALLGGAALFSLLLVAGPLEFYFTPLGLGLVYLGAATAGGKRGGYWPTALVLIGWGAAVALLAETALDVDTSAGYLTGAGVGALAGAALDRAGFAVSLLGVAGTTAAAGLLFALEPSFPEVLGEARTYALLVGLVGLGNIVAGALGRGSTEGADGV